MVVKFLTRFPILVREYMRLFILFAAILLCGCSSFEKSTYQEGSDIKEMAISLAIRDFSKSRLFKRDSVFLVHFEDSVFHEAVLIRDGRIGKWIKGGYIDGIVGVTISSFVNSYIYPKDKLPRYMIVDNKLFYWEDDSFSITEEGIAVLRKYGLLQSEGYFPFISGDDGQKGAHYYFCKGDLTRHKRVITNIGFGYYEPPRIKCR